MPVRTERLLRHIRRLTSQPAAVPDTDAALLERFVRGRDEGAFAALVARHGPMVLGVCRRVLRDAHEAEDAFQATFLVLARKAAALRRPAALAAWLYGTARHLALTCRRAGARRQQREARGLGAAPHLRSRDPLEELSAREVLLVVDEEVQRLPEAYRLPVVLCCLEGQTQEEAARRLGWTPGAVKGRLERGRARLHARLVRRALTLAAALAAVEAARGPAPAGVPAVLWGETVRAALAYGAFRESAPRAARLAEEALRGTAPVRARVVAALLVLGAGLAAAAAGALAHYQPAAAPPQAAPPPADRDAQAPRAAETGSGRTDRYGDPLPAGAVARLGTVRWRHTGLATRLTFSPDDKVLASVCWDKLILWDTGTGRELRRQPTGLPPPTSPSWPSLRTGRP